MSLLSRDQILGAEDRTYETVPVPEWGGEVRLRGLSGRDRDEYEQSLVEQRGTKSRANLVNMRAKLVALSAVDEDGRLLFSGAPDVVALGKKSAAALDRLFSVCQRLSGLSDEDVKELEEGFGDAPNGASTSVSPSLSVSPSANSSPGPAPVS